MNHVVNSTFITLYFVSFKCVCGTIITLMKFCAAGVVCADKIVTPLLSNLVAGNSLKPSEIL